jgi:hypothetical protein
MYDFSIRIKNISQFIQIGLDNIDFNAKIGLYFSIIFHKSLLYSINSLNQYIEIVVFDE